MQQSDVHIFFISPEDPIELAACDFQMGNSTLSLRQTAGVLPSSCHVDCCARRLWKCGIPFSSESHIFWYRDDNDEEQARVSRELIDRLATVTLPWEVAHYASPAESRIKFLRFPTKPNARYIACFLNANDEINYPIIPVLRLVYSKIPRKALRFIKQHSASSGVFSFKHVEGVVSILEEQQHLRQQAQDTTAALLRHILEKGSWHSSSWFCDPDFASWSRSDWEDFLALNIDGLFETSRPGLCIYCRRRSDESAASAKPTTAAPIPVPQTAKDDDWELVVHALNEDARAKKATLKRRDVATLFPSSGDSAGVTVLQTQTPCDSLPSRSTRRQQARAQRRDAQRQLRQDNKDSHERRRMARLLNETKLASPELPPVSSLAQGKSRRARGSRGRGAKQRLMEIAADAEQRAAVGAIRDIFV